MSSATGLLLAPAACEFADGACACEASFTGESSLSAENLT